jgi:tetratricopeptide (TPR) repeat protein
MTLNDIASSEGDERRRLVAELFRRGAACFEEVSLWRDAADCWQAVGDMERAAAAFAKLDDHRSVARIQMARGHYDEALSSYRQWLAVSPKNDVVAQITCRLGIAACLQLLQQGRGEARIAYREARALIDRNASGNGLIAGQCWEALAVYGVYLRREDIISVGYERALAKFGDRDGAERTRAARVYLDAVKENVTLEADIRKRLAEWD